MTVKGDLYDYRVIYAFLMYRCTDDPSLDNSPLVVSISTIKLLSAISSRYVVQLTVQQFQSSRLHFHETTRCFQVARSLFHLQPSPKGGVSTTREASIKHRQLPPQLRCLHHSNSQRGIHVAGCNLRSIYYLLLRNVGIE